MVHNFMMLRSVVFFRGFFLETLKYINRAKHFYSELWKLRKVMFNTLCHSSLYSPYREDSVLYSILYRLRVKSTK